MMKRMICLILTLCLLLTTGALADKEAQAQLEAQEEAQLDAHAQEERGRECVLAPLEGEPPGLPPVRWELLTYLRPAGRMTGTLTTSTWM